MKKKIIEAWCGIEAINILPTISYIPRKKRLPDGMCIYMSWLVFHVFIYGSSPKGE